MDYFGKTEHVGLLVDGGGARHGVGDGPVVVVDGVLVEFLHSLGRSAAQILFYGDALVQDLPYLLLNAL
jgi:hypothetical protein